MDVLNWLLSFKLRLVLYALKCYHLIGNLYWVSYFSFISVITCVIIIPGFSLMSRCPKASLSLVLSLVHK